MGQRTEIHISGFNPLQVTLPKVDVFVGEVEILLPDVHVKWVDLSMGIDLLKGAHIGSDGPALGLKVDIEEPGVSPKEMMGFILDAQDVLEKVWRKGQEILDEHGPLLDRGKE